MGKGEGKSTGDLKREIRMIERELSHLAELQWAYLKRLMKFGFAAWFFGVSVFSLSVISINPVLITTVPPIVISLLVLAAAAPVVITVLLIQKFYMKIKRLERVRHRLLVEKHEIKIVERELSHLVELQWRYIKRLMKFGFAALVFGVSVFSLSVISINPVLITTVPPPAISILILAAAAPVVITVLLIQKYRIRINHLERVRRRLIDEYKVALLRRVRDIIFQHGKIEGV